jgi:phytoene synthase
MQHSQAITRKSASNLALAFVLLPRPKRDAMAALYAFCREVDDVADEDALPVATRRARLAEWRQDIQLACTGGAPQFPVNREFQPVIRQYDLPFELLDELIRGCEMDLEIKTCETYEQLELYCHRVASVVGLLSIRIFGCRHPASRDYARHLGQALQLTNILRDVRADADRGRIYLPLEELTRCGVTPEEILNHQYTERYRALAGAVAGRARDFYQRARLALPAEDRRALVAAELMARVYWRLLLKLEHRRFNVFGPERIRLGRACKVWLILRSWLAFATHARHSAYGTP